jgi:serine/threonine-protein kinase HipA
VQPKVLGAPAPEKLSVELRQFRGSTHILKASTTRFPFLAANEFLCLGVLAQAGICVPRTTLSADGQLLPVDRFDVQIDGHLKGFEEAAALMGETSETKYQRDVGSMIEVLCDFIAPLAHANTRLTLAKALVLNHLLGNGDAHLKNFGVLYDDETRVELAPIYDCVSTLPYIPNDVPALTLSVEWYSKAWWPRIKIEEFVADYGGLSQRQIVALFEEAFDAVMAGVSAARQYGRDIAGFADLAETIATLWMRRVERFRAEPSGLKKMRPRNKR